MIRVLVADDHAIVRHGLRELIDEAGDMRVVDEAGDGRKVLQADLGGVDVLVLDLSLPRVHGTEVLRRLRHTRPELPVVVLSMYPEDQYGPRVLQEGASAYVSKDRPPAEVLAAIRAAAAGQRTAPPSPSPDAARWPHAALTAREHQVFTLIIQGRSVGDIAAELDLTSSTVSNHLAKIREKLGVHTVAEIVRYAHRVGLID